MVKNLFRALLVLACCSAFAAQPSDADRKLFRETKARADKGDALAQLEVGNFYFAGTGVKEDPAKGLKYHRKAAEQGLAAAQYQLALEYATGDGSEVDHIEAAGWFRKAAEQNLAEAQVELGLCYVHGRGLAPSGAEAIKWFRKAVNQGSMAAEYQIGKCYLEGTGFPTDIEQGVKWIRHAAERGYAPAQTALAECYEKGTGVQTDRLQAYKWFTLAAARDDAHAIDIRVSVAKMEALLSKEQIADAQRQARDFKAANLPLPDATPDSGAGQEPPTASGSGTAEPGFVNVSANQESSEVFADGAFMGNLPSKLKLKEGAHVIEVKCPGFKAYRKQITVTAGSDLNLKVILEKE